MSKVEYYPKMKDSGTAWLKDIPIGWTVSQIGSLYVPRNERVSDKEYPPLSVTMKGIVPQLSSAAKTDDGDNRKLVCVGDFAINSRSDRRGSCGISPYDGSVSLINTVLTPRNSMHPGYYNWLFHTDAFADEFYKWGHGIVDDLWTTRWQEMKRIKVPVPSHEVQQAIAHYLDSTCGKIDNIIEAAKSSIEDYKLWKTSIISEAVTQGLRPEVHIRNSGNNRIGTIPAHWVVRKMKTFVQDVSSGLSAVTSDTSADESGNYVLRTSAVSSGIFKAEEVKSVLTNAVDRLICPVEKDTLIMSRMNTANMVGYCAYVADDYPDYFLPDKLWKIHTKSTLMAKYAWFLINAPVSHDWFASVATGTSLSMLNISLSDFYNLIVAVPPIDEQKEICEFLDDRCSKIDACISEKQTLISDLESYKKSLIYEVVTGKRKVV